MECRGNLIEDLYIKKCPMCNKHFTVSTFSEYLNGNPCSKCYPINRVERNSTYSTGEDR